MKVFAVVVLLLHVLLHGGLNCIWLHMYGWLTYLCVSMCTCAFADSSCLSVCVLWFCLYVGVWWDRKQGIYGVVGSLGEDPSSWDKEATS